MKVAAIIQARMGSTRFPGKVLETIGKHPLLFHVVERVRYSKVVDAVVLATTTRPEDKAILKRAREYNVIAYTGPEHDVLRRYVTAATLVGADIIVHVPADDPLVEPSFIDKCVDKISASKADYCYVTDAPLGAGVDVVTFEALKRQDEEAKEPHYREHVNSYIKDHPDTFVIVTVAAEPRLRFPDLRLTVDTKDDLRLIRRLYKHFYQEDSVVSLSRVVAYVKAHPDVMDVTKHVAQRSAGEDELGEEHEPGGEPHDESEADEGEKPEESGIAAEEPVAGARPAAQTEESVETGRSDVDSAVSAGEDQPSEREEQEGTEEGAEPPAAPDEESR